MGTPTEILWTDDYEDDIGQEKLLKKLMECDNNGWIMTGSVLKRMKASTKDEPAGVL